MEITKLRVNLMPPLNRRELLSGALAGAAAGTLYSGTAAAKDTAASTDAPEVPERPWDVIDTNVSLFQWPFRRMLYDTTGALVDKLESLRIAQAWAGSFEGLLHRDITGVNLRLAEACREEGRGRLVPFGSLNLELPDWEEDLRQCHEQHRMPGIRLHPNYHDYALDDPRFTRLLTMAAERGLLVQLAASMEDVRTQHPKLQVPDVDLAPLPDLLQKVPKANVLLLNFKATGAIFIRLADCPQVYFDIARVESTDGVARILRGPAGERTVFGTHAPFLIYESALIKAYESDLTERETRSLFADNARRLLS